jgi:glycosyltransferase
MEPLELEMSNTPRGAKISVVTTTYNSAGSLADCLDSVASQTYAELEHIVIDGASRDGSQEILDKHRTSLARLVSEPDEGVYFGLNKGIVCSTGDIVGFLHADDVYQHSGVLETVASAFEDPSVEAVYGDLVYVDRHDLRHVVRRWHAGEFKRERLRWGWMPPHPTLYMRRSLYERFGVFDTRYRIAADYDLMLRVLSHTSGRILYLPQVLVRMRMGGVSNQSLRHVVRKSWEDYRVLRANRIGGLRALAWKNLSKVHQFVRTGGDESVSPTPASKAECLTG